MVVNSLHAILRGKDLTEMMVMDKFTISGLLYFMNVLVPIWRHTVANGMRFQA